MKWFTKSATPSFDERIEVERSHVVLNVPTSLHEQLRLIDLQAVDLQIVRVIREDVSDWMPSMVDAFYEELVRVPSLRQLIEQHSTLKRLKGTLARHILQMFDGQVTMEYIEARRRIAERHVQIGLHNKWYIVAFQKVWNVLSEKIDGSDW
ncbi:protoglobin domain-containing protein [Exiguobacterium sp. SL14]|nr:protoglobin domain-containing protein [Exiguobacterium sp. SL14]MCY1691182.1 protoglobin domain-containing protein [Exiguobacterium sp. SL14]